MVSLADQKNAALVALLGVTEGATADLENQWLLQETGETEGATRDLWILVFLNDGVSLSSYADMAYAWLNGKGFIQSTLNGKWLEYWSNVASGQNSFGSSYDESYG